MADFKLGPTGTEATLPDAVVEELPTEYDNLVDEAEMEDGSFKYNFKDSPRRSWKISFENLTSANITTIETEVARKAVLNYINGYVGLAAGVSVVVASYTGPVLVVATSGMTTPRFKAELILREA